MLRCDVQWPDDCVEGVIDALDDLSELTLVLGGIRTGGKVTLHGGLDEHIYIFHLRLDGLAHLGVSVSSFFQLGDHLVEVLGQVAQLIFRFDLQRSGLDLGDLRQVAVRQGSGHLCELARSMAT